MRLLSEVGKAGRKRGGRGMRVRERGRELERQEGGSCMPERALDSKCYCLLTRLNWEFRKKINNLKALCFSSIFHFSQWWKLNFVDSLNIQVMSRDSCPLGHDTQLSKVDTYTIMCSSTHSC